MYKKEKKGYLAPRLTVVCFKTERGYALSFESLTLWDEADLTYYADGQQMEDYSTGNGWNSGSNHFWD